MLKLKPCPFCGGEAVLIISRDRVGYGEYESMLEYHVVECANCKSRGTEFRQLPLVQYTSHTVQDFRKNPILRAKVEDEYDAYIEQTKQLAIEAWNTRYKEVRDE